MEVKYKSSIKSSLILWGCMILPLGLLFLLIKEEIENLPLFFIIGVMPSVFMNYKTLMNQDKKILQYLDYRRNIIMVMIFITVVFVPYLIFNISFSKILGVFFVVAGATGLIMGIVEILDEKKAGNTLNKLGIDNVKIKIPGYKNIIFSDIDEVIEYKDGANEVIGIIVDSALRYKEKVSIIDKIVMGRKRRVIVIKKAALISNDKDISDKIISTIKKNIK